MCVILWLLRSIWVILFRFRIIFVSISTHSHSVARSVLEYYIDWVNFNHHYYYLICYLVNSLPLQLTARFFCVSFDLIRSFALDFNSLKYFYLFIFHFNDDCSKTKLELFFLGWLVACNHTGVWDLFFSYLWFDLIEQNYFEMTLNMHSVDIISNYILLFGCHCSGPLVLRWSHWLWVLFWKRGFSVSQKDFWFFFCVNIGMDCKKEYGSYDTNDKYKTDLGQWF